MPKRTKVAGTATPGQVQAALKTYKKPHEQKRLLALKMAQQGQFTRAQIGDALNKSRATIGRWLKAYLSGGIQALLKRGHGGKQPTLQPDDIDALKDGLRSGQFKTAKEIANWLEKERGIQMKKSGIYYWLDKVKVRHNVPRKAHAKQDPNQKEAFKRSIVDQLDALEIPKGCPIRIWVEDEHRYGLISTVRRCWTLSGHRVVAPYHTKYQWGYVYGACELIEAQAFFLLLPTVSLVTSQIFLEHLVQTDPEAIDVVIWDQAGFHPEPSVHGLPEQIRILPLPPYCPELNPMEKLWDQVQRSISNAAWQTLDAIESEIVDVLQPFWQSVSRVRRFLGENWLTRGVGTFLKSIEQENRLIPN